MPFYEYVCKACGAEHEILQRISDAPETVCPSCQASALVKQISAAGFRLKGGGWYETDFKSGDKRNVVGSTDKPAADAKPAAASQPAAGDASAKKAETQAAPASPGSAAPTAGS